MANKEKIIILIGILMLSIFLFFIPSSVSEITNTFNDSLTIKNFSGIGKWSNLTYIKIPKTATITNASLNITGLTNYDGTTLTNLTDDTEDAFSNSSNCIDCLNAVDEDYSTLAYNGGGNMVWLNINYTKPDNVNSAIWQVKSGGSDPGVRKGYCFNQTGNSYYQIFSRLDIGISITNYTIPSECFTNTPLRLNITLDSSVGDFADFYEESVIWAIDGGKNSTNVTLDIGNDGDVEFNATGSFSTKNKTDFTTELTSLISSCTADASGFCSIPINISGTDGTVNLDAINITFTEIPRVNITFPINNTNYDFNIITLNYTAFDANLNTCWYSLNNGVTNTTITCGTNATGLSSGEGNFNWTIYANDTDNNISSYTSTFSVAFVAPTVNLVAPANDTYFNTNLNINLSFNVSDPNGISTVEIWHNFNGSFSRNLSRTDVSSSTIAFNLFNISSDGVYIWNVWANDTTNRGAFNNTNYTLTIDTTYPVILSNDINITTPTGSQTITFNVSAYTEINCNNSFYSVFNTDGTINNNLENQSLTSCSLLNSTFTVSGSTPQTYNLTVYLRDKSGNENSTTKQFTTVAGGNGGTGGGGGGGGTVTTEIPVIALQDINSSEVYSDLTKAILYSTINNYCSNKINKEPLAVVDYSQQCQLTNNDLLPIINNLKEFTVDISEEDLRKFLENYKQSKFLQTYATEENIKEYGLFTSVLGETTIWLLTPPSIDSYFSIFNREGTVETLPRVISSNKGLKSCEVVSNTPNLICEVTSNYTAKLSYEITDTSFFTKTFSGTILLTTEAEPERTEQRRSQVTFRVINFGSNTAIYSGIGTLGVAIFLISVIVRKRKQKFSKQVRELISLK